MQSSGQRAETARDRDTRCQ